MHPGYLAMHKEKCRWFALSDSVSQAAEASATSNYLGVLLLKIRSDDLVLLAFLVFFQRWERNLRLSRIRAVNRRAVVAQRFLCEAFGVTRLLRALGPRVAI